MGTVTEPPVVDRRKDGDPPPEQQGTAQRTESQVRWFVGAAVAVSIAGGMERCNTTRSTSFALGAYVAMMVVAFAIGTKQRSSAWSIGLLMVLAYSY